MPKLTIEDLGWTREQAQLARGQFAAFADLWNDEDDVYDDWTEEEIAELRRRYQHSEQNPLTLEYVRHAPDLLNDL